MSQQYGQPVIITEPALSFSAPESLVYVNASGEIVSPSEKIAGIICKG